MRTTPIRVAALALASGLAVWGCGGFEDRPNSTAEPRARDATEWPVYGGTDSLQYSPLDQIDRGNVSDLEVAWTYHTGDLATKDDPTGPTSFQATPILVDGVLYFPTPLGRVIALDPATGAEHWTFDAHIDRTERYAILASRGVAYWEDPERPAGEPCARRILFASADAVFWALDAATGERCGDFGDDGRVDLNADAGEIRARYEYDVTSPPLVIGDRVLVGAQVIDNVRTDAPSGVVRAFDARSGALRWAFDFAPPGFDRAAHPTSRAGYALGSPNVWAPMSSDPARDLVFVPTGNPSPDHYRGNPDLDYYGSSVVALRGSTGEVVWSFQTVHHDLWDYDVPAQPTLVDLPVDGRTVPALVVGTKMAFLFVLDRETGEPIFGVEERPVPQDGAVEHLSPTQPFPVKPPPLLPLGFEPWGFTFYDRGRCEKAFEHMRFEGYYTPPGTDWSITYPAPTGGINWGGVAVDPETRYLVTNVGNIPMEIRLIPRAEYDAHKEEGYDSVDVGPQLGTPFAMERGPWIEVLAPCSPPPWGFLVSVDLEAGEIRWKVPLGKLRDLTPIPLDVGVGFPSLGGPLVTGGGVIFIGAAPGHILRAFDTDTGDEIWRGALPAGANATPMTYEVRGEDGGARQFVVVAAGGHWGFHELGDSLSDTLVAFALPEAAE